MEPTGSPGSCPTCGAALPPVGICSECGATRAGPPPPTADAEFTGPKRIAGYRVLRELGAGGMGAVYEAFDERMKRHVALKVLSRHQAPSAKSAQRFEQEAWIAGKLDHPNLVKVYERGEWEELSFYSMELIDGGSLYDVVRNMRQWGRDDRWGLVFGTREYVHWAISQVVAVSRGLDYAHRHGVVHRDVKPMNLLLSREPRAVKIADFGLAVEEEATRLTTAGKILGTLSYMAPEQILGKSEQIGPSTDVYALGVTLFELLTLELPYTGQTQQLYMNAVLTVEARRASKLNERVSQDLETVILKALEKDAWNRYATAADLADDLENVLNFRPVRARPAGPLKRTVKWIQRKPIHAALLAVLVAGTPVVGLLAQREIARRAAARQERIESLVHEARWLEEHDRPADALARTESLLLLEPSHSAGLALRAMNRLKVAAETADQNEAAELRAAALADASRLVDRDPTLSWPHALKARVLQSMERADDAAHEAELARERRPEPPSDQDLEFEARLALGARDYERARAVWQELVARRPDSAEAIAALGNALSYLGRIDEAYAEFRLAIGLNPEYHLTYIDLARLTTMRGDLDEGARYIERALALHPDSGNAHEVLAQNRVDQGKRAEEEGRIDDARRLYEEGERAARRAIELAPLRPWAYVNLGAALNNRSRLMQPPDPGLLHQAVEALETGLGQWPRPPAAGEARYTYVTLLGNSCDSLILLGELSRAIERCLQATQLEPGDALGFYNLAGAYALMGRADDALAALRRDLELGDTDWEYLAGDPWFESLHENPGFPAIVEAMKRSTAQPKLPPPPAPAS